MTLLAALPAGAEPIVRTPPSAAPARPPLVIVWLENHSAAQINRRTAPYLSALRSSARSFSNYRAVASPSLPNYLAFASGSTHGKRGTDAIRAGEILGPTIWRQLTNHRVSWGVYQESMPTSCYRGVFANGGGRGPYVLKHNPAMPFRELAGSAACRNVMPLAAMPVRLPQVSFVTPATCNDMHGVSDLSLGPSCVSGTVALIRRGDRWMRVHVRRWRSLGATVVVTFDEGGGALYSVVAGAGIPHGVFRLRYTHFSLLAALERRFGLPRLGAARFARPLPLGP